MDGNQERRRAGLGRTVAAGFAGAAVALLVAGAAHAAGAGAVASPRTNVIDRDDSVATIDRDDSVERGVVVLSVLDRDD